MAAARWDPFRDLNILQERISRAFEDAAGRQWKGEEPVAATSWSPAVDIYETDREILVQAELPGIDRKDIALQVENSVLTLKGDRRFEREANPESYHRIERSYGGFSRTFAIPAIVDESGIRADFKDGILKIALPKKEQAKARQIRIGE